MQQSPAPDTRAAIGLLALANYLASVGGGRVLSAGKGLTGIKVLGSGSLLALVMGSVLSLLVLRLARRIQGGRALVWVSAGSAMSSLGLLWMYRSVAAAGAAGELFAGRAAWFFFGVLVIRCALWMAGRALRTGRVSSVSPSGLALSEAAYFGGLVTGLLVGLPELFRAGPVASAFSLDIVMLVVVTLIDLKSSRAPGPAPQTTARVSTGADEGADRPSGLSLPAFARLASAYSAATIGCQIVVFQLADALARSSVPQVRAWSDSSLAAFYAGVATMAVAASILRPALMPVGPGRWPAVIWGRPGGRGQLRLPVAVVCLLAGVLVVSGVFAVFTAVAPTIALAGLLGIAVGSGLFEIFALAVLGKLSAGGQQAVAAALGVAATAATAAMLLMLAAGANTVLWSCVSAAGLGAAAWLVREPPPATAPWTGRAGVAPPRSNGAGAA